MRTRNNWNSKENACVQQTCVQTITVILITYNVYKKPSVCVMSNQFSHTTSTHPYYGLSLSGGLSATPEQEWVITGDRSVRW